MRPLSWRPCALDGPTRRSTAWRLPRGSISGASAAATMAQMGEPLPGAGPARLTARSSVADRSTLLILRNGRVVAESRGGEVTTMTADAGAYRVEVRLADRGSRAPWIFSNPIYVDLPAPAPPERSARGRRGRGSRARRVAWGARQLFDRGPGRRRRAARVGVRVGLEVGQPVRRARGAAASARACVRRLGRRHRFRGACDESPFSSDRPTERLGG